MEIANGIPLIDEIGKGQAMISVLGLGYVGIPLAVAFSRITPVVGYDINPEKVSKFIAGQDVTHEVGDEALRGANILFTTDEAALQKARFHIIAVPTPINPDKTPDLLPLISASETLGRNLRPGSVVVYESTVYPGATEEICIPALERCSGLVCGKDFKIGYSPERINPGDKVNRLENIVKIVSGMDGETLELIAAVYSLIIKAGVHRAQTIKVAEAAKVVENSQRDINIAFVNELSCMFDAMDIDTNAVIDAMDTKWNALGFRPGLVGGHCIGVDPYYLIYQAQRMRCQSPLIADSRRINDGMSGFIVQAVLRKMIVAGCSPCGARIGILGVTFKENCNDVRNSRVVDLYHRLCQYGIKPILHDPIADAPSFEAEYGLTLSGWDALCGLDCVIVAVSHDCYRALDAATLAGLFSRSQGRILVDVKGIYRAAMLDDSFIHWCL